MHDTIANLSKDDPLPPGSTTMLLSRLAESVYWTGRYLERAEGTARVLASHTELFLDLPKEAGITFAPLLFVTGSEDEFALVQDTSSEEHVVAWLASDPRNPGSVLSCLERARQNLRSTRALFPREAWEVLNHLYLCAAEGTDEVIGRRSRLTWLDEVVTDVQRLTGLLAGSMSHDDTYQFLRIGRHIERADMTTRVLDVRAATLLDGRLDTQRAFADVQWMQVLRSLSAHQMYRRTVQTRVLGPDALRFLLQDPQFPRSVSHCLAQIAGCLDTLPRHEATQARCADTQRLVTEARAKTLAWDGLHEFVDEVQLGLAEINTTLTQTYFRADPADAATMLETA